MNDLKCLRCGRDGHLPADCNVPVLPDGRVLAALPAPMRVADALSVCVKTYPQLSEDEPGGYVEEFDQLLDEAVGLLRTQHAEIADLETMNAQLREQNVEVDAACAKLEAEVARLRDALLRIDSMCAAPPNFSDATIQEVARAALEKQP